MSTKIAIRSEKRATASRPAPVVVSRHTESARFVAANRVFFRLYQASNLMHRTGSRAVSGHGATTQQWAVMGALARPAVIETGMSVKDMMLLLAVSRQSLSVMLNRLEGLALVERVRTEGDGRVRRIRLTAHGRKCWTQMLSDIRGYYSAALADFSTQDAEILFGLLDRLTVKLRDLDEPELD